MPANTEMFLVVGASGFIGRSLIDHIPDQQLVATYNSNKIANGIHFDATTMSISDILPAIKKISSAFILLGETNIDRCARDAVKTYATNVTSVIQLIAALIDAGIFIVFASTDSVFDGEAGNYLETDQADPILVYGKQKLEVETYLANSGAEHCVARISKVYGTNIDDGTIVTNWVRDLQFPKGIRVASDQYFTPVYIGDVIQSLLTMAKHRMNGLFHLGGPKSMNRVEMINLALSHIKGKVSVCGKIIECSISEFGFAERRPLDCSLNSQKLISELKTAFKPPEAVIGMIEI